MAESILSRSEVASDLFCTDYDRCVRFYRDTLGLRVEEPPAMPGNAIVYAGNGTQLGLHSSDRATTNDHTSASFLVDDVESAVEYLRSKGVKLEDYENLPGGARTIDGVANLGGFKIAWFKDPEGNILCVSPRLEVVSKAA
jgi:catechol 2,3-dioxygenase-like lactoylglutathione lyase family enzyme